VVDEVEAHPARKIEELLNYLQSTYAGNSKLISP
jgi:hypothetical protein